MEAIGGRGDIAPTHVCVLVRNGIHCYHIMFKIVRGHFYWTVPGPYIERGVMGSNPFSTKCYVASEIFSTKLMSMEFIQCTLVFTRSVPLFQTCRYSWTGFLYISKKLSRYRHAGDKGERKYSSYASLT
jgi:hypothetical protein